MQIVPKRQAGIAALELMDRHLASRDWFVGDHMTLADICLFAYTHVADEADFDLELYPAVIRWIERIMLDPRLHSVRKRNSSLPSTPRRVNRRLVQAAPGRGGPFYFFKGYSQWPSP